jgi:hypothetical protein
MKRLGLFFVLLAATLGMISTAPAQTPPTPIHLTAEVTKQMPPGVDLHWDLPPTMPPIMPTVYKVYRSVDDSTALALLNITDMSKYNDRQVQPGHTYYYAVSAVWIVADTAQHEGGLSNIASATIQPPPDASYGVIEGSVTDSLTGSPVPYARISFFRPTATNAWTPQAVADSVGHYSAVLITGTYYLLCRPPVWMEMAMSILPPYLPEWYDNARNPWDATPVPVAESSKTTIDFDLVRFSLPPVAHVSGTVMDVDGIPLKGAWVFLLYTPQAIQAASGTDMDAADIGESATVDGMGCVRGIAWKGRTDSLGQYDARVLSGRTYLALAGKPGYAPQFFDHASDPADAKAIAVNGNVADIDFNLVPLTLPETYTISGVVQDSAGVRVPSRIVLFPIYSLANAFKTRFVFTDSLGLYKIPNVLPGRYHVLAVPFGKYAPSFYKEGEYGVFRWKDADTVLVADNDVAGIDIGVVPIHCPGIVRLRGFIRKQNAIMAGVRLLVRDQQFGVVGSGLSDDSGAYTIDNLPEGQLNVTVDRMGYVGIEEPLSITSPTDVITQDYSLQSLTSVGGYTSSTPDAFMLRQNYPNPFNPSTRIDFTLPVTSEVRVSVFNLLGQEIATLANGSLPAGDHQVVWSGHDALGNVVATGVYFYRLDAKSAIGPSFSAIRKMMLVK